MVCPVQLASAKQVCRTVVTSERKTTTDDVASAQRNHPRPEKRVNAAGVLVPRNARSARRPCPLVPQSITAGNLPRYYRRPYPGSPGRLAPRAAGRPSSLALPGSPVSPFVSPPGSAALENKRLHRPITRRSVAPSRKTRCNRTGLSSRALSIPPAGLHARCPPLGDEDSASLPRTGNLPFPARATSFTSHCNPSPP